MLEPHGVMFHHFHDQRHPHGQGSISGSELAKIIRHLGRRRILSADEWLERAGAGTLQPHHLCFTFDDNLRCQYDVAVPVLKEWGITAFWFVYSSVLAGSVERLEVYRYFRTTCFANIDAFYEAFVWALERSEYAGEALGRLEGFRPAAYLQDYAFYTDADRRFRYVRDEVLGPERYDALMDGMLQGAGVDIKAWSAKLWMDDDCLRRLQAGGHIIGLHSHTHPMRLERLDAAAQEREYRANHAYLSRLLGAEPVVMSHPCNSYNEQTLRILRELRIRLGFRSNMASRQRTELEYPREDHTNLLRAMSA